MHQEYDWQPLTDGSILGLNPEECQYIAIICMDLVGFHRIILKSDQLSKVHIGLHIYISIDCIGRVRDE